MAGTIIQTVSVRRLHEALGVRRDFSDWIKGRIKSIGCKEDIDFVTELDSPIRGSQLRHGGRRHAIEYHLALDMAKELAMVENNERGRAIRRPIKSAAGQRAAPLNTALPLPRSLDQ